MNKLNVYSSKGDKKSDSSLPKDLAEEINMNLLAQAIRIYENRMHPGLSRVKTRSEVVSSKAKMYRQKGTGRARHGAPSAPIFVGGGKAHGPKGVKRELSMPQKMRDKALKVAISLKAKEGKLLLIEGISDIKKTKDAANLIKQIASKEKFKSDSSFLFALADQNKDSLLYLRNLQNVKTVPFTGLNAYNVYFSQVVVIDKNAIVEEKGTNTKKNTKTNKNTKAKTKKEEKSK